ncbi:MAG: hypothetical protein KGJ28_04465 [Alphaproteobacteria bacterium]|nr:hypothetical protein [Alphaproteobacteria bacterium]
MQEINQRRSTFVRAASYSWKSAAKSATAAIPRFNKPPPVRDNETQSQEFFAQPHRPSGICEAQRIDFNAACDGKITWYQYFVKWGRQGLSL